MHLIVAGMTPESVVDGPGIRLTLFLQGCPHHCPGCHNPETWPLEGGVVQSLEEVWNEIQARKGIQGVTFSGGEPFLQAAALLPLAQRIHASGLDLVIYTGYTLQELSGLSWARPLLLEADWLIDGPYLHELRSLDLPFRGSKNQKIWTRMEIREILEQVDTNEPPIL